MNNLDVQNASDARDLIAQLDEQFAGLHRIACDLVGSVRVEFPEGSQTGVQQSLLEDSFRENILRGAAAVEQTFGGITANLWDDPFEWTLPETLNTRPRLIEYLDEVEATRRRAFSGLINDGELHREIVVPSGERQTLLSLFRETLSRAVTCQSRALEIRDLLVASDSDLKLVG